MLFIIKIRFSSGSSISFIFFFIFRSLSLSFSPFLIFRWFFCCCCSLLSSVVYFLLVSLCRVHHFVHSSWMCVWFHYCIDFFFFFFLLSHHILFDTFLRGVLFDNNRNENDRRSTHKTPNTWCTLWKWILMTNIWIYSMDWKIRR